jgi:peptide/nickel transport system permease protein
LSQVATVALGSKTGARRGALVRQLFGRWPTVLAIVALTAIVVGVIFAPLIAPYSPDSLDFSAIYAGPSWHHLMGTDELGRDLFSRMLYGGRYDLIIASLASLIALVIGFAWGAAAAIGAGWLDNLLMRTADISMAIPGLVIALILVSAFGPSVLSLTVVLGVVLSPWVARVMRAAIRNELNLEYTTAAVVSCSTRPQLIAFEVLPNVTGLILVQAAITAANVILLEATLAFVGLGIQPPAASWGTLLQAGYNDDHYSIWYGLFPGLVIFIFILSLNTIADHMQQALDPRRRS